MSKESSRNTCYPLFDFISVALKIFWCQTIRCKFQKSETFSSMGPIGEIKISLVKGNALYICGYLKQACTSFPVFLPISISRKEQRKFIPGIKELTIRWQEIKKYECLRDSFFPPQLIHRPNTSLEMWWSINCHKKKTNKKKKLMITS